MQQGSVPAQLLHGVAHNGTRCVRPRDTVPRELRGGQCPKPYPVSIEAMLVNRSSQLIRSDTPESRWAIWVLMYWRKVVDIQQPYFWIVVSSLSCNLSAIAPLAQRKWDPTKSGLIARSSRLRVLVAKQTALTISLLEMVADSPSVSKYQSRNHVVVIYVIDRF